MHVKKWLSTISNEFVENDINLQLKAGLHLFEVLNCLHVDISDKEIRYIINGMYIFITKMLTNGNTNTGLIIALMILLEFDLNVDDLAVKIIYYMRFLLRDLNRPDLYIISVAYSIIADRISLKLCYNLLDFDVGLHIEYLGMTSKRQGAAILLTELTKVDMRCFSSYFDSILYILFDALNDESSDTRDHVKSALVGFVTIIVDYELSSPDSESNVKKFVSFLATKLSDISNLKLNLLMALKAVMTVSHPLHVDFSRVCDMFGIYPKRHNFNFPSFIFKSIDVNDEFYEFFCHGKYLSKFISRISDKGSIVNQFVNKSLYWLRIFQDYSKLIFDGISNILNQSIEESTTLALFDCLPHVMNMSKDYFVKRCLSESICLIYKYVYNGEEQSKRAIECLSHFVFLRKDDFVGFNKIKMVYNDVLSKIPCKVGIAPVCLFTLAMNELSSTTFLRRFSKDNQQLDICNYIQFFKKTAELSPKSFNAIFNQSLLRFVGNILPSWQSQGSKYLDAPPQSEIITALQIMEILDTSYNQSIQVFQLSDRLLKDKSYSYSIHYQLIQTCLTKFISISNSHNSTITEYFESIISTISLYEDINIKVDIFTILTSEIRLDNLFALKSSLTIIMCLYYEHSYKLKEIICNLLCRLFRITPLFVGGMIRQIIVPLVDNFSYLTCVSQIYYNARLLYQLFHFHNEIRVIESRAQYIINAIMSRIDVMRDNPMVTIMLIILLIKVSKISLLLTHSDIDRIVQIGFVILTNIQQQIILVKCIKTLIIITGYIPQSFNYDFSNSLLTLLFNCNSRGLELEITKLLGVVGSVCPNKVFKSIKINDCGSSVVASKGGLSKDSTISMDLLSDCVFLEPTDYFNSVCIKILLKLLRESNKMECNNIIDVLTLATKMMGIKSACYLDEIINSLLIILRYDNEFTIIVTLKYLTLLYETCDFHMSNYTVDIIHVLKNLCSDNPTLMKVIVEVADRIVSLFGNDDVIKHKLINLIPDLKNFSHYYFDVLIVVMKFIRKVPVDITKTNIITDILIIIDTQFVSDDVKIEAIKTIVSILYRSKLPAYSGPIVRMFLTKYLRIDSLALRNAAVMALQVLAYITGRSFGSLIPHVTDCVLEKYITKEQGDLIKAASRGDIKNLPYFLIHDHFPQSVIEPLTDYQQIVAKDVYENISKNDLSNLTDWMKKLVSATIMSCKYSLINKCYGLVPLYPIISKDLFFCAFVSIWSDSCCCWNEMMILLENVLRRPLVYDIHSYILDLVEYVERYFYNKCSIPSPLLCKVAYDCQDLSKALYYGEMVFNTEESVGILCNLYNLLDLPAAVSGILLGLSDQHGLTGQLYEQIGEWESALKEYKKDNSEESIVGYFRCLLNLGYWEQLETEIEYYLNFISTDYTLPSFGAITVWELGKWQIFDNYTKKLPPNTPEREFYLAVGSIANNDYESALHFIDLHDYHLSQRLKSYSPNMVSQLRKGLFEAQLSTELREVVGILTNKQDRHVVMSLWNDRLNNQKSQQEIHQLNLVRSFVYDSIGLCDFTRICLNSPKFSLTERYVKKLFKCDDLNKISYIRYDPELIYFISIYLYENNSKDKAYSSLLFYIKSEVFYRHLQSETFKIDGLIRLVNYFVFLHEKIYGISSLKPILNLLDDFTNKINSIKCSTNDIYELWHNYARYNYEAMTDYACSEHQVLNYCVNALEGFLRTIPHSETSDMTLQHILRFIMLWFKYAYHLPVRSCMNHAIQMIHIDNWLLVLPQLISMLDSDVNNTISCLLNLIGRAHPQALFYHLIMPLKSGVDGKAEMAMKVLSSLHLSNPKLKCDILMMVDELIRIGLTWEEVWYEGLEDAFSLYTTEQDIQGMLEIFNTLYEMIDRGPDTDYERQFMSYYGSRLSQARRYLDIYKDCLAEACLDEDCLSKAWNIYLDISSDLSRGIQQVVNLSLSRVSPKLFMTCDLEVVVPGTYKPGEEQVLIHGFVDQVRIIATKRRPRRIIMIGSDGNKYEFLLKGHEDLRQDERVTQFFSLINAILRKKRDLKGEYLIVNFAVIPLSHNSGLIQYVPQTDTIQSLIKEYRSKQKKIYNESQLLEKLSHNRFEYLGGLLRMEVFDRVMRNTPGTDLASIFWLKSNNSQTWFFRRQNFIQSFAFMSIVGYVLGLGDRHPLNIMIHRKTGNVVHIDFGDCFEVAMMRDQFPETVPFRLTRMCVLAMDAGGVCGYFLDRCIYMMKLVRENKESLMAVLESFIHDPLMAWRLSKLNLSLAPSHLSSTELQQQKTDYAPHFISRVKQKLTGTDLIEDERMSPDKQVQILIDQATSTFHLSQMYIGWCPFW